MSWSLVPSVFSDFGFFDRQRDLFPRWLQHFGDDWRAMDMESSLARFDRELENIRESLFPLNADKMMLDVDQPFVTDASGNRKLSLRFNCSEFKPEEITVKTTDKHLSVHAKHVEEGPGKKIHREFTREYTLPKNVDPKALKSTLSKDGVLSIEAPAPAGVEAPKENLVPIEKLDK